CWTPKVTMNTRVIGLRPPKGLGYVDSMLSAARDCAALCPIANESFRYLTISALVFSASGPLSPFASKGDLSPVIGPHNWKLVMATCFTCSAKVRTPLNSLPERLSPVGAKSYLSSGMASAAPTNSLSTVLTSRSISPLMVGGGGGVGEAAGAAALACAIAAADRKRTIAVHRIRACFIRSSPSLQPLLDRMIAEAS